MPFDTSMGSSYQLIIDSSALERGLGNIRRWERAGSRVKIYVPTYTLNELEYLSRRVQSTIAREALLYLEQYTDIEHEIPEIVDAVSWREVLGLADSASINMLNKLPARLKQLLRSCVYKRHLDNPEDHWVLLTEDARIREAALCCQIPCATVVEVDSMLSKDLNDYSFRQSAKFNEKLLRSAKNKDPEHAVAVTDFKKSLFANRGKGKLWSPP